MLRQMRRLSLLLAIAVAGLAASPLAFAVQPGEVLTDATLETRARALSRELRCMVCQNQSIDDSDAPLARDLRVLVRERLQAGDSDHQVIDFLVSRYGEFVLLKPRFSTLTAVLWLGPAVILLVGAFALFVAARRRSPESAAATAEPPRLTAAETARLSEILHSDDQRAGRDSR